MAGADNFGLEARKADEAVEWLNEYAGKNKLKLKARLTRDSLETVRFGNFRLVSWDGEWATARNAFKKVSGKLNIKVIESGYHEKQDLLTAFLGGGSEYAKVYSSGRLVGNIQLEKKSGRWVAKSESFA